MIRSFCNFDKLLVFDRKIFPEDVEIFVQNDAIAALASGSDGKLCGCVLVAGTGTIALGFNSSGKFARASGGGPLLGDQGRLTSTLLYDIWSMLTSLLSILYYLLWLLMRERL